MQRELSLADLCAIIDQVTALGCFSVRLTGGEPLLRPDFAELYVYLKRKGMQIILFTNATLINPEMIALLQKYPPRMVEVTLYGMTRASYEAISRTPNSFAAAMNGIQLLREAKIPLALKGVALPPNQHELRAMKTWAESVTSEKFRIAMKLQLRARRDDERKNRLIRAMRLTPDKILEMYKWDEEAQRKDMEQFRKKFIDPSSPDDRLLACGAGVTSVTVDAYGLLQPCMSLRHPAWVYDLKNGAVKDALENFIPELRSRRAQASEYLARCARCAIKPLCEQCPGWAWMECGAVDQPIDYLCEIAHAEAIFFGLLQRGEKGWQVVRQTPAST
jgi:radical SAM protein with 4Fe4S-binding SPASM domain